MWANAQRDGRPVEYRWRVLQNTGKTVSVQATATRHEVSKLLQVPVRLSEGLLY